MEIGYKNINDLLLKEEYNKVTLKEIIENSNNNSLYFFDDEIKNKQHIINNIINYKNNKITNKIFARKCELVENISTQDKSKFLNDNHLYGNDISNYNIGAYYNNELIALMTFNNNRSFNKEKNHNHNVYELSRFSIKENYSVVGIGSKIIKNFIRLKNPLKIVTFLDLRFATDNNVYEKIGFKKIKKIPPNHYYITLNGKRLHKYNFGKNKIKNKFPNIYSPNKTETSMMMELGYKLVWDGGKIRYEMDIENNKIIIGYIYKITNQINNKLYIGQTLRPINKRISEYKKALLYDKFYNMHLYSAFKKYGFNNFKFEIIDTAETIDELNEKEIFYILNFDSTNKSIGYNLESGGRNSLPSKETLEKLSKAHKGVKQTEEWINNRIYKKGTSEAKKYGKIKTDEEKKHLSENSPKYWLGKKRNPETIKKISETKRKNGVSQKTLDAQAKKVYVINLETNNYETYHSTVQASKMRGVSGASVSRYCNANKIKDGFKWTYNKPE